METKDLNERADELIRTVKDMQRQLCKDFHPDQVGFREVMRALWQAEDAAEEVANTVLDLTTSISCE